MLTVYDNELAVWSARINFVFCKSDFFFMFCFPQEKQNLFWLQRNNKNRIFGNKCIGNKCEINHGYMWTQETWKSMQSAVYFIT